MKLKVLRGIVYFLGAVVLGLSSCEQPENPDTLSAEDEAKGSFITADAFAMANEQADGGKGIITCENDGTFSAGYTDGKWVMVFDSCMFNSIVRNGTISVEVSDWSLLNASMKITFDNYSVDGEAVSGAITATRTGVTKVTILSENMSLVLANGESISWNSEIEYSISIGIPGIIDNSYVLNGSGSGVNREGQAYTSEYKDVTRTGGCVWPVSGTLTISKDSENPTIVDFGDGDCDNSVEISKGSFSTSLEL